MRKMRAEPEECNVVKTRDGFLLNIKPLEGKDPAVIFTASPALVVELNCLWSLCSSESFPQDSLAPSPFALRSGPTFREAPLKVFPSDSIGRLCSLREGP